METLLIPVISYPEFKVLEALDDEVSLYPEYFRLRGKSRVERPDEKTGLPVERLYDYDIVIDRILVSAIVCGFSVTKGHYEISIESCGNDSCCLVFESKSKALEMHNKLIAWKYEIDYI